MMDIIPMPDSSGKPDRDAELRQHEEQLAQIKNELSEAKSEIRNARRRAAYHDEKKRRQSELEAEHERIVSLPKAEQLGWVTEFLGMRPPIKRFVQTAPDCPTYAFELEGGDTVGLGTIEEIHSPRTVVNALRAHIPDGYPDRQLYFDQAVEDRPKDEWKLMLRVLFDCRGPRECWDLATRADQFREEWLPDYLDAKGAFRQTEEDRIRDAILKERPFFSKDFAYFSSDHLRMWLWTYRFVRLHPPKFRELLRRAGAERGEKPLRVTDDNGRRQTRRYWRSAI